jgi:tetratricopeptide (TPR) repeat protein
VQGRWADIHYGLPEKQREAAFAELAERAGRAVAAEPEAAELRIWHGIVLSTWAGAKGGLGALGLVKEAKAELETALRLDPRALDGSAYTSLGSLYYQVPGWPVGFGDDAQAEKLLKQALAINPGGIDPNYFHGDFLSRQKRYAEARTALEKALAAPTAPGVRAPTPAGARRRGACSSRWPRSWRSRRMGSESSRGAQWGPAEEPRSALK